MSIQYVIDGYNLLNHPQLAANRKGNSDRLSLLDFIKRNRLTGSPKNKVTVVFDGYPDSRERFDESDFCVVFSRMISADEKIRKLIEESGQRKGIVVVSDDRQVQDAARALGANVSSIEEFVGKKDRQKKRLDNSLEQKVTYSDMEKINSELRKIWLK
jgi:predicted RNA-binding protein with PIN domain